MPGCLSLSVVAGAIPLLSDALRFAGEVIHEDVLTEAFGRGVKGTALVDLRHLVDELHQGPTTFEHERVDDDTVFRAAHHFAQRFLNGAERWRVAERCLSVGFHVRRWLTIRNDDDLLVSAALT